MMRNLIALVSLATVSASPVTRPQCQPAPVVVQTSRIAPNSTYVDDGEPPARFSHVPSRPLLVGFGQKSIDELCGVPPCGLVFEGCTDGDRMALPNPFTTDSATFARIARHELAHHAGWPATHGA